MKLYTLAESQRLPIDLTTAWAFFSNPANLSRITPPKLGFEVTSPLPPKVYSGLFITYKVRPLAGIPVTWVTEITNVDEPVRFVDEQRVGPYRIWHHEHQFIEIPGGVEMRDQVTYALPYGVLGQFMRAVVVKNSLREIFGYRRKVLAELFGTL
ncbi:MAG: SRPBCC family protein [Candidatus Zixiibacteriota bacterium]